MASNLDPQQPVETSQSFNMGINESLLEEVEFDDFDDILVPGDDGYIDPDMADPAAGVEQDITAVTPDQYPVTSIDASSITRTRKTLPDGTVVYDIRFNIVDIGANSYEVAFSKV